MIFKLAFRNVISKRSSFVIILFMAFAVTLFCVANAIFDSTENGVQTSFISSFTGDVVIRPYSKGQMSLFGDETPVTGSLTRLEKVVPYKDITNLISNTNEIQGYTSQLTGSAALEFRGRRKAMFLFGVESESYLSLMPSVHVIDGNFYESGKKGVMISRFTADSMGIKVGDEIQFTVADGPYFRIRKARVSGIYDYETENAIFERYVLIDPEVLCSLMDISDAQVVADEEIAEEKTFLLDDDLDFDSLFDDVFDSEVDFSSDDIFVTEDESMNSDNDSALDFDFSAFNAINENQQEIKSEFVSWNYIICRAKDSSDAKKIIKKFNKTFKKNGWPVQATDWRHAAGSTALYLYWMRLILNIGIAIVLVAGFIIVNNTLTINVLDRTREIGTLRAIGAKKRFISAQCMVETFMMTITSGILGSIFGIIVSKILTASHIQFSNSFLCQLFGSDALVIYVTGGNILKLLVLVIALGVIGWIYPVLTALRVNPVKAMQGAK